MDSVLVLITVQSDWQVTSLWPAAGKLFTDLNDCREQKEFCFKTSTVAYEVKSFHLQTDGSEKDIKL